MKHKTLTGCIFAILSAVIYGCMPLMAKYIYADGVNPLTLVFLRNFFSLIPLAVLGYRQKKTLKVSPSLLPNVSLISLLGCCFTPILLFSSYNFIASGLATVFHFAYPTIVVIGGIVFMKKKANKSSVISVLLCAVGLSLFYTPSQSFNLTGGALALLSAITFAGYVLMLSRFDSSKLSGFLFSFYIALISSIATFIICVATSSLSLPSSLLGWVLCVVFSLLVTTGAVALFQQSTFLIGGECSSILSTLEPITSIIIGVMLFSEPFGVRLFIGTVLVILASIITVLHSLVKQGKAVAHKET